MFQIIVGCSGNLWIYGCCPSLGLSKKLSVGEQIQHMHTDGTHFSKKDEEDLLIFE